MAISDSQLEIWSRQGAVQTAESTYASIRRALSAYRWPPGVEYEVYLQGSYRNSTNIRGDSDVDVVVQCNSVFYADTSWLSDGDLQRYDNQRRHAEYDWTRFRADVLRALQAAFGPSAIREGRHSIKLLRTASHLPADVVPSVLYRRFQSFGAFFQDCVEGMTFWAASGKQIVNFPKLHYQNGIEKNQAWNTAGHYKSAVRMFKNAKFYLVEHNWLPKNTAPSYFLECLLYNIPDNQFLGGRNATFYNGLNWLANNDFDQVICQNRQHSLFGPTQQQWKLSQGKQVTNALIKLWNENIL